MLATLAVMGLLAMGAIKGYHFIVNKIKAQNTAKMIKTLALERQNSAINIQTGSERTVKGPHSALHVVNGVAGNHEPYFWVETTLKDSDFCEALKESNLIQAEFIEVDGVQDGSCTDNSKIAFYFKKDKGGLAYCPSHSTNCDAYGDATGCQVGYYLNDGVCSACGAHVETCKDENTPTTCAEGYELHWGQCITPPQMCTMDSDCDVCATCDTETGYCQGECEVPAPDSNQDCGENECIVYDEDTQTCKYACTRVEYLESTGTQWIDTGIKTNNDISMEYDGISLSGTTQYHAMGYYFGGTQNTSSLAVFGSLSGGINAVCGLTDNAYRIVYNDGNWTDRHKVKLARGKLYVDDVYVGERRPDIVSYNDIWVMAINNITKHAGRCYSSKIWKGDTLVRDFIPVLSPFGRPAMFDRVTQKLFCNQGTEEDFKTNLDE